MARGGLYRTEVEKARAALVAQGKHPSVDAVRVALGNTGSKTTIHRYLKEIEAELGADRKVAISDALQDLVARLAARLQEEAEVIVAEEKARCKTLVDAANQLADQRIQEAAAFLHKLESAEAQLTDERSDHVATRQQLIDASLRISQLDERNTGLVRQADVAATHTQSIEKKHEQAREALEHFRTSMKEQRDQDQRRHEHQIQELQVELRKANESIGDKNHQILQLNRDNARLTEHQAQLERQARQAEDESRQMQRGLDEAKAVAADLQAALVRLAQHEQSILQLRSELNGAATALTIERERRIERETELARERGRVDALEALGRMQRQHAEAAENLKK